MLAHPTHSRVLLINSTRTAPGEVSAELGRRRRDALVLLSAARELFGIDILAIGEYEAGCLPETLQSCVTLLDVNIFSLWDDQRFSASFAASDVGVLFLGGAWLEEELLIAALKAARHGYDVRVLADISIARTDDDRALVLNRFALHGVLTMTVRQALLEWSVSLDDAVLKEKVRLLLA